MNYRDFDPYNDEAFWEDVGRDSEARLAEPLPFALEAIEDLFRHESDKERGFGRWQRKLEQSIWWADDAIQCLEKVLAAPPANLGDVLREHGINIWVQGKDGEVIGDAPAHVDWLRGTARHMREMFESYVASKSAELKAERDATES
jgi:hypothetical protein